MFILLFILPLALFLLGEYTLLLWIYGPILGISACYSMYVAYRRHVDSEYRERHRRETIRFLVKMKHEEKEKMNKKRYRRKHWYTDEQYEMYRRTGNMKYFGREYYRED